MMVNSIQLVRVSKKNSLVVKGKRSMVARMVKRLLMMMVKKMGQSKGYPLEHEWMEFGFLDDLSLLVIMKGTSMRKQLAESMVDSMVLWSLMRAN
jgi:hypothetical protein